MTKTQTKTIIIGSAMAFSFLADVVQYSLAASKGGKFAIKVPQGKALYTIIGLVLIEAIAIDFAIEFLEHKLSSKEELAVKELAEKDKSKVKELSKNDIKPIKIIWQ